MGVAKNVMKIVAGADHIGELQAWDIDSGKKAWTTNMPPASNNLVASRSTTCSPRCSPLWSPVDRACAIAPSARS
jgi:hypothetical protein